MKNLFVATFVFLFSCGIAMADWLPDGCTSTVTYTACVNPIALGPDNPDCKEYAEFVSCTACEPCYERDVYGNYPNNEMGDWSNIYFRCFFNGTYKTVGTGTRSMYEYMFCDGETVEYRCASTYGEYNVYPTGATITCNETINDDGTIKFGRCNGCNFCNTDSTTWRLATTGYQQKYKYTYQNVSGNYCPAVATDEYRCGIGYYGTATVSDSTYSGCTKCPTVAEANLTIIDNPQNLSLVTSVPGSTSITDCVATTGDLDTQVTLNDGTGDFHWHYDADNLDTYSGNCNYSN